MYAYPWALCCLATVFSFPALAQEARVEVLLHNASVPPGLILGEMKSELGAIMKRAGFQIEWHGAQASNVAVEGDLVVVELRGSCEPPATWIHDSAIVRIGSSAVADGKVLPFSWVDCTALAQFLKPYLIHKTRDRQELAYGRAMARVLAHEFYHILGQTLVHTESGLTKARLEPSDLLDARAGFGNIPSATAQPSAPHILLAPVSKRSIRIPYP